MASHIQKDDGDTPLRKSMRPKWLCSLVQLLPLLCLRTVPLAKSKTHPLAEDERPVLL